MVYNGPSTGCGTCRKRKVKCDQGRPGCNNCEKRKQQCPGYQNVFDTHHRNETAATIKRLGSRSDSDSSPLSSFSRDSTNSPSSSTSLTLLNDATQDTCFVMNEWWSSSPLRTSLTHDPEILSIAFLFDNFNRRDVEPEAVHGMMTHLTPIYAAAPASSPIKCATAAIALNLYMLFRDCGSDTKLARASYASAVTKVKRDLLDPNKASSDELMVAIFLLNFYEMLNARFFPNGVPPNDHKNGMMALVKHRGNSILASSASRTVATCIRNCLAEWAIDDDIELPYEGLGWVEDDSLSQSAAARLDLLSLRIVQYRSKVRRLEEVSRKKGKEMIQSDVTMLLTEAAQLDDDMQHWVDSTPPSWDRLYVQAEDLPPSIVAAGVYGDRCSVFTDLSVCDTWSEHRLRWVLLLRITQQCASHSLDPAMEGTLIKSLSQRIQLFVDDLLETVPLFIGDCTVDVSYAERHSLQYPRAIHENGNVYPNPLIDHTKAAVSWGGWCIYGLLLNILKMASPQAGPFPIDLRPGQIAWIFGQVGRLQAIYTFMSMLA